MAIEEGADLAVSSWDILSGDVKPADDVLLFDDNGAHSGMAAAEFIAAAGSSLEIVSPERLFAPEIGGLNLVPYMKTFTQRNVRITTMTRVRSLKRQGNKILATLWSPYSEADCATRLVDQVMSQPPYNTARRVFWVMDNGSSHRGQASVRRLTTAHPRLVPVHGPVHASWLNQIEIYFSIVQRKVLTPNDFPCLEAVAERLANFERYFESIAHPFEWKFTRADLNALIARMRNRWAQSQPLKLAA